MATLNELIYNIKNIIYNGSSSDDSLITDEQVLYWYNTERANAIFRENERMRGLEMYSQELIQDLGCVEIECVDKAECCDLNLQSYEYIFKTKKKIPRPLNRSFSALNRALGFTYIGLVTKSKPFDLISHSQANWIQYDKRYQRIPSAFYLSDYLYFINLKNPYALKYVNVMGIFFNPDEASQFQDCSGEPCFDRDSEYPIPAHLLGPVTDKILNTYVYNLPRWNDFRNNARDERTKTPQS